MYFCYGNTNEQFAYLQRSQPVPGPMSPRFQGGVQPRQNVPGIMRAQSPAPNRLSPFGSGGAPPGSAQGQWNQRASQNMMTGGSVTQQRFPMGQRMPQTSQAQQFQVSLIISKFVFPLFTWFRN